MTADDTNTLDGRRAEMSCIASAGDKLEAIFFRMRDPRRDCTLHRRFTFRYEGTGN